MEGDLSKLADSLTRAAKSADSLKKRMVNAAALVYERGTRTKMEQMKMRDTGTLIASVRAGSVRFSDAGAFTEVYARGKRTDARHRKGARNETISFVLEHGKGKGRPRPHIYAAAKEYRQEAFEAAQAEMEQALKEAGL